MAIAFPNIDPVAVHLGPLAIRWYALAYIAGIVLGWWLFAKLHARKAIHNFSKKAMDDIVVWVTVGIILGGRFGYVCFYNAPYYLENPIEALYLWHGGMSFHGGLAGVLLALYMFSKKYSIPYFELMDTVAVVVPIGLFFGRIANFINGELYGRVSDVPWAMVFPHGGELARHPSQLYQAGLEGLALFVLLFGAAWFTRAREKMGLISGLFLLGYATARIIGELFREPDAQLGFLFGSLTMGQLLCVPMILLGAYLVRRACRC